MLSARRFLSIRSARDDQHVDRRISAIDTPEQTLSQGNVFVRSVGSLSLSFDECCQQEEDIRPPVTTACQSKPKKFHRVVSDDRTMNTLSVRDLCCLFCCPPLPSRIAAKLGKRVIFVHTR